MAVKKDKTGRYRYRKVVKLPDGNRVRISGTPTVNNREHAIREEREHIERVIRDATIEKHAPGTLAKRNTPTLAEWFRGDATGDDEYTGRFWREHAIGQQENRSGTLAEKRKVFEQHLEPALGELRLDEIDTGAVNAFRADLKAKIGRRGKPLSEKTRANILGVLGTALRYAEEVRVIERSPSIKVKAVKPPPIECWDFDQYGRLIGAAAHEGEPWETAVLLAGECGLRIGEIIALEWTDLDLIANTITIARQERQGVVGPPKGGKARTVPMTARLATHLRSVPRIHTGRVVARAGEGVGQGESQHGLYRICRYAGLPERGWHKLRHSYATHAALLGVNPIRLQHWLGHSTLSMTLRYVHFAEAHSWPIPDVVLTAGAELLQPERRLVAQLGARPAIPWQTRGNEDQPARKHRRQHLKIVGVAGFEPALEKTASKRRG